MKKFILGLVILPLAYSQASVQLSFSTGSSVKINSTGSRDIVISSTTGSSPAGVQFTLTWSPTLTQVSVTAAAATTAASKTVQCGNISTNTDGTMSIPCIVDGINQNLIANGSLATVHFSVSNTASSAVPGTLTVSSVAPLPPLSVDLSANVIATVGGSTTIPFAVVGDLNGDGKVDSADLLISMQQAVGTAPCGSADLNGDGKCDLVDVQLLVKAALGL